MQDGICVIWLWYLCLCVFGANNPAGGRALRGCTPLTHTIAHPFASLLCSLISPSRQKDFFPSPNKQRERVCVCEWEGDVWEVYKTWIDKKTLARYMPQNVTMGNAIHLWAAGGNTIGWPIQTRRVGKKGGKTGETRRRESEGTQTRLHSATATKKIKPNWKIRGRRGWEKE